MKFKIDRGLLPIKAHFFFFFAALGPLLPQMNVFGRQLGVSPGVMGLITAVLPLLWAAAKPLFGYVVDYWPAHRKLVFMLLITIMTGSYCCLWFLPMPEPPDAEPPILEYVYTLNDTIYLKKYTHDTYLDKYSCHWNCSTSSNFAAYLSNSTYINTLYVDDTVRNDSCSLFHMEFDDVRQGEVTCVPKIDCNLLCFEEDMTVNRSRRDVSNFSDEHLVVDYTKDGLGAKDIYAKTKVAHRTVEEKSDDGSFYMTASFWAFVVLMCLGTVAFNVANCIGDAVCFDVLGPERSSKYGAQRAWGTAGYGITALLGGWLVDSVSSGEYKDFTPAFVVAIAATAVDLYSCRALTLPALSSPEDSGAALRQVLKMPRVLVFIVFAVVAGTFDSFIIYYMFWFLEELAEKTGHMAQIKLIEGVVVAGQSFIGELLFFYFSGKIIKRWGYGPTMSFSLLCYGLRMVFISLIQHPWHLVFIESIMQGPTYALCYSCIVGYAAHVAPEGYSATVQGIVAGMDDGVGKSLSSSSSSSLHIIIRSCV
ncbi:major facilitator superfamily domain-containing protein 6 [Ostrinia furnacalis]|uniref:major facilitator superfamily domain-containing protein 6 n=1 Tax=Ostrinia furnacalis TaxID=93504 RepID=UPI00103B7942|nr:major facilitator superfamily domain-containing protein 6 [Ostrinia furnacalis]